MKAAKRCSHDGSTNGAVRGGVYITHGEKVERKHCSFEGCVAFAQKGGVCKRLWIRLNESLVSTDAVAGSHSSWYLSRDSSIIHAMPLMIGLLVICNQQSVI